MTLQLRCAYVLFQRFNSAKHDVDSLHSLFELSFSHCCKFTSTSKDQAATNRRSMMNRGTRFAGQVRSIWTHVHRFVRRDGQITQPSYAISANRSENWIYWYLLLCFSLSVPLKNSWFTYDNKKRKKKKEKAVTHANWWMKQRKPQNIRFLLQNSAFHVVSLFNYCSTDSSFLLSLFPRLWFVFQEERNVRTTRW